MKNIIILFAFIVCGINTKAQTDTTTITNFTIQLRHAVVLMPNLFVSGDSSKFNLYVTLNKIIKPLSKASPVTTVITIPSISVTNILAMYLNIANTPAGYGLLASFQSALAPYRSQNTGLNSACTSLENNYIAQEGQYYNALLTLAQGY